MFTVEGIRKLHGWTHESLGVLLDHLAMMPEADYGKSMDGFGFSTVRGQVIHLLNCEGFWVHTLQGQFYVDRAAEAVRTVDDARQLERETMARTEAYLSGLTDAQLNSDQELRFRDGDTTMRTPALVLHHMLTHAFHHKGQVVAMCRLLGRPVADTDLIRFG